MSLALRVPRTAARLSVAARPFSNCIIRRAEGDAGAPRGGGAAQGDAFTKREQASEDLYVRQQEREKLEALKKKIAQQQSDLDKSQKELDGLNQKK